MVMVSFLIFHHYIIFFLAKKSGGKKKRWDKSPSLSIVFGLTKTQWLSGLTADFIIFYSPTQLCGWDDNRILTTTDFVTLSECYIY